MICREKCIVIDIDGTLCPKKLPHQNYGDLVPYADMVALLHAYKQKGFYIILASSRNMNTFDGNVGRIQANTAKVLLPWLDKHSIPYDELHLGKPWSGHGGFYVDDKAIRPDEFKKLSYEEIIKMIGED